VTDRDPTYADELCYADLIVKYWKDRGTHIDVTIERMSGRAHYKLARRVIWGIRSDMVNGLPRRSEDS
jgi:hypothetical protein